MNAFTVTFDPFNASLLKEIYNKKKGNLTDPKLSIYDIQVPKYGSGPSFRLVYGILTTTFSSDRRKPET